MNAIPSGKDTGASVELHVARSLRPTTSKSTGRYDGKNIVHPSHAVIKAGLFLYSREPEPAYLPPQWSPHIHPEGQLYFYRNSTLRVVTEAYLYCPETIERISYWAKRIEDLLFEKDISLSDDVELFLQLEGSDCAYYFVDHVTHTEFWMDPLDTDHLSLSPVISTSHLKLALEELYWCHVEHFPMHNKGISSRAVDDLICVFSHAQADHMTSSVSTFPYSEEECTKFLALLETSRERISDGHIICFVARLWSLVASHKFSTHYGQEHARLSRDQAILIAPVPSFGWVSALSSAITFRTSDTYLARLEDVFVDNLVYAEQWRPFMRVCLRDWKGASFGAFASLMLHIFLFFSPSSPRLAIISASLLCASLVSSVLLVHRHEPLENATASEAFTHLDAIRSEAYRFRLVALVFSLPKVFYLWGLGVFVTHWLVIAARYFSNGFAAVFAICFIVVILGVQWITSSSDGESSWAHPLSCVFLGREVVENSNV